MQFFNTGNPQIDQLNKLGERYLATRRSRPRRATTAPRRGGPETAKTLIDTQRQRFMNDKLYNLLHHAERDPWAGRCGADPWSRSHPRRRAARVRALRAAHTGAAFSSRVAGTAGDTRRDRLFRRHASGKL